MFDLKLAAMIAALVAATPAFAADACPSCRFPGRTVLDPAAKPGPVYGTMVVADLLERMDAERREKDIRKDVVDASDGTPAISKLETLQANIDGAVESPKGEGGVTGGKAQSDHCDSDCCVHFKGGDGKVSHDWPK